MTENFDQAPADEGTKTSPVDLLRATGARVGKRFQNPAVRRRSAIALLLIGGGMVGWQVFGPDNPTDVAAGLSQVTDAAKVVASDMVDPDALPSMPTEPMAVAALATPPRPAIADVRETQATTADGPCMVTVDAMPLAAATVAVDVTSPCDPGRRVDIIQTDLHIAITLDAEGFGTVEMPALSAEPTVAVLVTDRDPVTVQTESVDYGMYHRAVLHWQGAAGLELHAFEGDAAYGDEGHVGPENLRTIAHALSSNGGFMTVLGDLEADDARAALVYTLPQGMTAELSIEVPVTEANCAQTIYGGTIQTSPGAAPVSQDITMTMPECDAVGDYIMLGNLMGPIAVASN